MQYTRCMDYCAEHFSDCVWTFTLRLIWLSQKSQSYLLCSNLRFIFDVKPKLSDFFATKYFYFPKFVKLFVICHSRVGLLHIRCHFFRNWSFAFGVLVNSTFDPCTHYHIHWAGQSFEIQFTIPNANLNLSLKQSFPYKYATRICMGMPKRSACHFRNVLTKILCPNHGAVLNYLYGSWFVWWHYINSQY